MKTRLQCNHSWEEREREKRVAGIAKGFLSTQVWYEWVILQRCSKCGLEDVLRY